MPQNSCEIIAIAVFINFKSDREHNAINGFGVESYLVKIDAGNIYARISLTFPRLTNFFAIDKCRVTALETAL